MRVMYSGPDDVRRGGYCRGMWSPTNREHEALEALVVTCVPWSEALEVGVDGARRSSAEEAPRLWACLASWLPL